MDKLLRKNTFICFFVIVFLMVSCQNPQNDHRAFRVDYTKNTKISQDLANQMEKKVQQMDEVDHVRAVSLDKDVYMTLTVSGFQRFFLEKIRKDAFDRAKSIDKNATVHVSTDRKIDMDLSDLEEKIYKGEITKKELEEKLTKVENDMKG